jgi:hypothetical protein
VGHQLAQDFLGYAPDTRMLGAPVLGMVVVASFSAGGGRPHGLADEFRMTWHPMKPMVKFSRPSDSNTAFRFMNELKRKSFFLEKRPQRAWKLH